MSHVRLPTGSPRSHHKYKLTVMLNVNVNLNLHDISKTMTNTKIYHLFVLLFSDGCNPDSCQNGGTCADGICVCVPGYNGDYCQTCK